MSYNATCEKVMHTHSIYIYESYKSTCYTVTINYQFAIAQLQLALTTTAYNRQWFYRQYWET